MRKNNKKAGFTLVEMVIVVSILGILSGVGFMKFGDIQQKSAKNADYLTAQNLAQATELGISKGEITTPTGETKLSLTVAELNDKGLISTEPKPQSIANSSFSIEINSENDISVKVGQVSFYPKP